MAAGRVGAFKCLLAHRRGRERTETRRKRGGVNGGVETVALTCAPRWHSLGSLTSVMGAEEDMRDTGSVPGTLG